MPPHWCHEGVKSRFLPTTPQPPLTPQGQCYCWGVVKVLALHQTTFDATAAGRGCTSSLPGGGGESPGSSESLLALWVLLGYLQVGTKVQVWYLFSSDTISGGSWGPHHSLASVEVPAWPWWMCGGWKRAQFFTWCLAAVEPGGSFLSCCAVPAERVSLGTIFCLCPSAFPNCLLLWHPFCDKWGQKKTQGTCF